MQDLFNHSHLCVPGHWEQQCSIFQNTDGHTQAGEFYDLTQERMTRVGDTDFPSAAFPMPGVHMVELCALTYIDINTMRPGESLTAFLCLIRHMSSQKEKNHQNAFKG